MTGLMAVHTTILFISADLLWQMRVDSEIAYGSDRPWLCSMSVGKLPHQDFQFD